MKRLLSFTVILLAALASGVLVSCKSKDANANPYASDPYYGPQGGAYGDYAQVQPATPPASDYGYTAPPPAPPSASPPAYSGGGGGGGGGGGSHTVAKGDTLFGLARRYNTTVNAIKSANGLTSDTIRIGQTLRIP